MAVLAVGVSSRALAQALARAGYTPVAVDLFGDRDLGCRSFTVASWSPAAAVDLALSVGEPVEGVMLAGGLEDAPDEVARLTALGPLWGNPPAVLRRVRDWPAVAVVLRRHGFAVPEGSPVAPEVGRWLVKPLAGGGGVGVRSAVPGAPAPPGCRLERYVEGTPGSVIFVAAGGEAVALGVTEQITGMPELAAPGFAYAGNILCGDPRPLQPLCAALAAWFGLVGVGGVDFIMTPEGPVVLEVNPRWTASMELWEQATGASLVALHVAAILRGELPDRVPLVDGAWGKAILYGERPGVWLFHGDWRDVGICDVPAAGAPVAPGRPVCTVLASGDDVPAVRERLAAKARRVRREWLG